MNTPLKIALLIGALVALAMFKPVQVKFNEIVNTGTITGVARCVDLNANSIISDEVLRQGCAEVFQQRIFEPDQASGRASAHPKLGRVEFSGTFENMTVDKVITWADLIYTVYDSEGESEKYHAKIPFWIEPRSTAEFAVPLDGLKEEAFKDLPGCTGEEGSEVDCWHWYIYDLKGVALN